MAELTDEQKKQRRVLLKQSELLWKLVTTTAGITDLTEPMKRAERHFERLTKGQRTTIAVIASQFVKGCHEIEKAEEASSEEAKPEEKPVAVEADEVIPPEHETDGSDTGE